MIHEALKATLEELGYSVKYYRHWGILGVSCEAYFDTVSIHINGTTLYVHSDSNRFIQLGQDARAVGYCYDLQSPDSLDRLIESLQNWRETWAKDHNDQRTDRIPTSPT